MTDRDSVIDGLDEITHYDGEQMFYNDIFIRGIAIDALALLKEQDAVKPITEHHLFHCPVCKNALFREQKFCHECGKHIKWEG